MKTRPVDGLVLDEVAACVSIGRERLRMALSGVPLFFLLCFSPFLVYSIIGLLDAGLGMSKKLEDAGQVDPRELDDGMFSVHELRETDHSFSSGCARQDNHLELQCVIQLGVRVWLVFLQVGFP